MKNQTLTFSCPPHFLVWLWNMKLSNIMHVDMQAKEQHVQHPTQYAYSFIQKSLKRPIFMGKTGALHFLSLCSKWVYCICVALATDKKLGMINLRSIPSNTRPTFLPRKHAFVLSNSNCGKRLIHLGRIGVKRRMDYSHSMEILSLVYILDYNIK